MSLNAWILGLRFDDVYMLDSGNRIDRRNAADIFTPLYNNQIPPGAAAVVHYQFTVPEDQQKPIEIELKLNYRKFDSTYMEYVYGKDYRNRLPRFSPRRRSPQFRYRGRQSATGRANAHVQQDFPMWQRWNDYGIGLLLKGNAGSDKGELKQAAAAFSRWKL